MDQKNINEEMFQEILEQLKHQNNRIAKLEKLLDETSISPTYIKKDTKEETSKKTYSTYKPAESKPIDWQRIELTFGKYGLQIVGVIIFLLGMGFLLKYSIEKGWFTPTLRVIAGFIAATGLLISAEVWRQKFKGWANAVMAGSFVLYYFSFYAAHNFYQLISINTAFASFFAVTLLAGIFSLVRDSLLMATFSLFGGYLTPLFLDQKITHQMLKC